MSRVYLLLTAALFAIAAACGWFYLSEREESRLDAARQLESIAVLKTEELVRWRAQRMQEGWEIAQRPVLHNWMLDHLQDAQEAPGGWMAEALQRMRELHAHDAILLVDNSGVLRWPYEDAGGVLAANLTGLIAEAQSRQEPVLSDIFLGDATHKPLLNIITPLFDDDDMVNPVGAVVRVKEMEQSLFPLFQRWPIPSESAELLLVRRDGDTAQYVTPQFHDPAPPLHVRVPLSEVWVPAVMAVRGQTGIVEGRNYQGKSVLAAIMPVADSPWYLIAQVDRAEALASWRQESRLIMLLLGSLLCLPLLGAALFWQERKRHYYEKLATAGALNARLTRLYNMLSHTNQLLMRVQGREELLVGVCRIAVEQGGFRFAWFGWADDVGKLQPVARAGDDHGYVDQVHATADAQGVRGRGPSGIALRTGEHQIVNHFLKEAETEPWHEAARQAGVGASAAFPVRHQGQVVGTLNLYAAEVGFFQDAEITTLDEMAADISFGLDNLAREQERAALLASLDSAMHVVEMSPTVLIRWGAEPGYPVRYVSPNVSRWGYTPAQFLSGSLSNEDVMHPEDFTRILEEMDEFTRSGWEAFTQTYRIRTSTGELRWMHDVTTVERSADGQVLHYLGVLTDITERMHASEALRESEERLRLALRSSGQGFYDLNIQTGDAIVSPEYAEMIGHDPDTFQETINVWRQRLHPEDRSKVYQAFTDYLAGEGEEFRAEFRQRTADGKWLWTLSVGRIAEHDPTGVPLRMLGTHTDISTEKLTEELLRLQSASLGAAANAIVITDTEGQIVWANPAFVELTGYSLEESRGRNPRELVASGVQDEAFYQDLWQTISAGKTWRGELLNCRKDGSRYHEDMTITPVHNDEGAITHFVAVKQDISERIRAQEVLQESQARLERAVAAGHIALWDWDTENDIFDCSEEFLQQIGCQRDELTGTIEDWFSRLHPDDALEARKYFESLDSLPGDALTHEFRMRHSDGTYRNYLDTFSIFRDEHSKPVRFSGANLDITERKRLEVEFQQAQKMESIGRLAGGVAHDFNNLLSVISGYAEMSLESLDTSDPLHDNLRQIARAAERAATLTRQLLAFSRRQILRPERLNLNSVVSDVSKMVQRLVPENITVTVHLDDALGEVLADPGQIEQVLMNLVVNARDAMPSGGTLSISTRGRSFDKKHVAETLELEPGCYAALSVADTGDGMDAATLRNIFEPFFTTKAQGKGTGLGLATVYGIVQQSGGQIGVQSEAGRGATFTIYLPCLEAEAEPKADTGEVPAIQGAVGGQEAILIAEDEPAVRELTERMLGMLGYQVMAFDSGDAALAYVETHRPKLDLLLTDVIMPGIHGGVLAQALATRYPGIRILFMSGYTDDAIAHHGVLSSGTHLINKPFSSVALAKTIRDLLDSPSNGGPAG